MNWLSNNWLKVLGILFALGALAPIPFYAYYQLMNWIVVGAALVTAWQAYRAKKDWVVWLFILVAVIFNPLAPLYFSADVWRIADIVAALLLVLSFYLVRSKSSV